MPSSLEQRSLEEGFLRLPQAKELVMKNNNQNFLQKISAHLTVTPAFLIIATGLWIATIGNIPLWKALSQLPEGVDAKFFTGFLTAVASLNISLIAIFAWGRLLKPVLIFAILTASITSYFMLNYGIVIDPGMVRNTIQTDVAEASDLVSVQMLLTVFILSAVPIAFICLANVKKTTVAGSIATSVALSATGLAFAILCIFLVYQPFSSTMRNHTKMRYLINPLNTFYSTIKVATNPLERTNVELSKIGQDAKINTPSATTAAPILLLLVGETARSESFGLNGYERNTTPQLSKRTDIFSSKNAWSCGTSTAESLPCMFSHMSRENYFSRKQNYENMLDVLSRAGLSVFWLDNQSGCKGICARIANEQFKHQPNNPLCDKEGVCQDSAMLDSLEERVKWPPTYTEEKGKVIVLHQMGSHGPAYHRRSSTQRKPFQPECKSVSLQQCTQQEIINAYDNSIVETDHFINSSIEWLKNKFPSTPTALIYVSDHGESLGESNIYLHGLPYSIAPSVQKNIPWIVWLSDSMEAYVKKDLSCIKEQNNDKTISHDNYFHTVLGLMNVQTDVYDKSLDISAQCAKKDSVFNMTNM
ncbi:phosphoethanolamine transferase [Delftia lacustris]|nr:phosphoethanolamine--lipid A transferase [Delftia lacustris]